MNPYIKPGDSWRPFIGARCKVRRWREATRLFSKRDGVWVETFTGKIDPYNAALVLVGLEKVKSLDQVLTNSEYCTALAGNAEACGLMKTNYSSEMTSAIDSNFSDGLNLLNYTCGLKCYLIKGVNQCTNITGGYNRYSNYQWTLSFNMTSDGMSISFDSYGAVATKNKVNMSRFSKVIMKGSGFSTERGSLRIQSVVGYDSAGTNLLQQNLTSATATTIDISSITEDAHICVNDWDSDNTYVIAEMYME